jgi:hypothetical protein
MFCSNEIQNGTTATSEKAEEYELGHTKVVYNQVNTEKGKGVAVRRTEQ